MPGVLACVYAAASGVQQLVLPLAGTVLAIVLVWALVTVVLVPSGRKRVPSPSTAAGADADRPLATSKLHASPTRLQVSVKACGCGLPACQHVVDTQQPDMPRSAEQESPCDSSDSTVGGSADSSTGLADGAVLIRKRVQHPGSESSSVTRTTLGTSSLHPAVHSHPAPVPAQPAAPSSPTAHWHVSRGSSPAPGVAGGTVASQGSSGAGARAAGSPRRQSVSPGKGAQFCPQLKVETSTSSGPAPSAEGRLSPAPGPNISPVGGLVMSGTGFGAAHAAGQSVGSSSNGGNSSSSQLQHSPASRDLQLGATHAAAAAAAHQHETCSSLLPGDCADAAGTSWPPPSSCSSITSNNATTRSSSEGTTGPVLHSKPLRRVSFAPLPPSKELWLQQLRLMPAESKARFMRRLHSVARKVWCMWRQHSRRQQQQQHQQEAPEQLRQHGLKRLWQQAAAESGPGEEKAEAASPCKKAASEVFGFSASRMSTD